MSIHPSRAAAPSFSAFGQLAASIAHEVDQPLAAIALNAQAALRCIERAQAPAQAEAALRNVLEASARATDILRGMRALAGQARSARTDCDLDAVIGEVLALHEERLAGLGVAPRVSLARGAGSLRASPVQLRQLLRNLVGNALDALAGVPAGRRSLCIEARPDGAGMLVLTVSDSGAGMTAAQARRAFEPMFTTKADGMGLGLAICRAIVDAHGGRIAADAAPDRGCTVTVALPRRAAGRIRAMEVEIG